MKEGLGAWGCRGGPQLYQEMENLVREQEILPLRVVGTQRSPAGGPEGGWAPARLRGSRGFGRSGEVGPGRLTRACSHFVFLIRDSVHTPKSDQMGQQAHSENVTA